MAHEQDYDRSLEIDVVLILGVFMLTFGLLLFPISAGRLPYSANGAYGLFLVLVSVQTVTMGKTPFGDFRRSWAVVIVGLGAAALGMVACFIPGVLTEVARAAVGIILLGGGLSLLLQLLMSRTKARLWFKAGPVLAQLAIACALVYALGIVLGVITLAPGLLANEPTAIVLIAWGGSLFYLAWLLRKVAILYPVKASEALGSVPASAGCFALFTDAFLPLSPAIFVLLGLSLVLLGLLFVPVSLGLIPFSPDGQLGLLLTIMAIQAMALGATPLGQLSRPSWMLAVGLTFAALGIIASIVPSLLTDWLRTLIGVLNIGSGAKSLVATYLPVWRLREDAADLASVPTVVRTPNGTQTAVNWLNIVFGVTMLVPALTPGFLMPAILVAFGLLLIRLAMILRSLAALQASAPR